MTYKVMPADGDVEYSKLEEVTKKVIEAYHETAKIKTMEEFDVGFGLKAVKVNFDVDEKMGSEALEEQLKELNEVGDVIIESMSRAMG